MKILTTRTTYAEHCYEQILLMEILFRFRVRCLDETDIIYYSNYIARAKELYNLGKFDEKGLLEDEDWDKEYNFRYDVHSIRGTHGEMLVHMTRNQGNGGTRSHTCSGAKAEELAGWDGEVYNTAKGWDGIYFQSKLLNTILGGSLIKIYHSYLKPSYTAHRLTLPDIKNRTFIEMSLPWMREAIIDDPDPKLVHKTFVEGDKVGSWIRKDYLMEKRKKFEFWEYRLI